MRIRLLGSRTFQFLVGPDGQDRTLFTIHTAVAETLSAPLATLMNGSMREAIGGVATLKEVDEQTFLRFCEYAYMGDYTPAQQQIVLPSPKLDKGEYQAECYCAERTFPAHKKDKKRKGGSKFADDVAVEEYCGDVVLKHPRRNFGTSFNVARILWLAPSFDHANIWQNVKPTVAHFFATPEYMSSLTRTTFRPSVLWLLTNYITHCVLLRSLQTGWKRS